MSALAGILSFDGRPALDVDCARMLAAQRIYGPHDSRRWTDGTLAMGRGLFRTVPEDVHDRQPLQSRDGRLTLIADVRLDNREGLIAEVGLTAVEGRQLCDAAILLESLERWGEVALNRLVGDFAFVLWDAQAQRLLLARDFIGQKPLHYHSGCGFFAFASMAKGMHALAEIPCAADEQLVSEFLLLMPRRGPRSFFRDVARVEPGHFVAVTRDGISSRRYWQPQGFDSPRLRSSEYVEGLRYHLDQAVEARLRGVNGAVASHLSAGLDSNAVTATAARLLVPRGGKVVAFTAVPRAGYNNPDLRNRLADEGPLAAATVAMYPNIEHVLIRSGQRSPLDGLDQSFYLYERPMPNLCNLVWVSAINQAARERKLSVMLVGLRGNDTLSHGGLELLPELLLAGRFARLWREAVGLVKKNGMRRSRVILETLGPFMPLWLWQWANNRFRGYSQKVFEYAAIRPERFAEFNLAACARNRGHDFSFRPWKDSFALRLWALNHGDYADIEKGILAGWGVDRRDPLADKRLVEFCLTIPTDQYLVDGLPRALAKRVLSDRVPAAILNERKHGLPAADWHEGLTAARDDVAEEFRRFSTSALASKVIDLEKIQRLIVNWPSSEWAHRDKFVGYRLTLVSAISAGHFLRKASGTN